MTPVRGNAEAAHSKRENCKGDGICLGECHLPCIDCIVRGSSRGIVLTMSQMHVVMFISINDTAVPQVLP